MNKNINTREMVGEIMRAVKNRIVNDRQNWTGKIIPNLNKDEVVHYALSEICHTSIENIRKPNAKECEILRHMIIATYENIKAIESENM